MEPNKCIFRNVLETCKIEKNVSEKPLTIERKETILKSSEEREDNCFKVLDDLEEHYHKDCYIVYTSKQKIERERKRRLAKQEEVQTPKRLRRLVFIVTNFLLKTLIYK